VQTPATGGTTAVFEPPAQAAAVAVAVAEPEPDTVGSAGSWLAAAAAAPASGLDHAQPPSAPALTNGSVDPGQRQAVEAYCNEFCDPSPPRRPPTRRSERPATPRIWRNCSR